MNTLLIAEDNALATPHTCNPACYLATGSECDCACKGRGHGIGFDPFLVKAPKTLTAYKLAVALINGGFKMSEFRTRKTLPGYYTRGCRITLHEAYLEVHYSQGAGEATRQGNNDAVGLILLALKNLDWPRETETDENGFTVVRVARVA